LNKCEKYHQQTQQLWETSSKYGCHGNTVFIWSANRPFYILFETGLGNRLRPKPYVKVTTLYLMSVIGPVQSHYHEGSHDIIQRQITRNGTRYSCSYNGGPI